MKMNKTRLLEKISIQSGISADECSAVLKTFERVLSEELTRKIHRYGGWILLLVALLVSAVAFTFSGTSLVTTLPAPITEFLPMVTPPII